MAVPVVMAPPDPPRVAAAPWTHIGNTLAEEPAPSGRAVESRWESGNFVIQCPIDSGDGGFLSLS
jgi:hypothetical protein